jgi:hypothetical protein
MGGVGAGGGKAEKQAPANSRFAGKHGVFLEQS